MKRISIMFLIFAPSLMVVKGYSQGKSTWDFSVSYGYSYFAKARRQGGDPSKQTVPANLKVWLRPRFYAYVQSDAAKSVKQSNSWQTGSGDTKVGADFMLVTENTSNGGKRPEVDIDYLIKIPTAKSGLGTGQVDHQMLITVIRGLGTRTDFEKRTSMEIDAGDYISGVASGGVVHSGLLTLVGEFGLGTPSASGDFRWKLSEELDGATASGADPSEAYGLTKFTYQLSKKISINPGVRVGITPYTPKFGVFFSINIGGNLRRLGTVLTPPATPGPIASK